MPGCCVVWEAIAVRGVHCGKSRYETKSSVRRRLPSNRRRMLVKTMLFGGEGWGEKAEERRLGSIRALGGTSCAIYMAWGWKNLRTAKSQPFALSE